MSVVNIDFWNNACFTKLNMMALKPEQAEQVRAYLLEKNIEKMSDFIWDHGFGNDDGCLWFDEPYNVGLDITVDGELVYGNKHAEDFFEEGKHLLPSSGWLRKDDLGDVICEDYLIQKGKLYGGFTFEFEVEGEFDIDKLQFEYYADGLEKDEKPHIRLDSVLYDGEEHLYESWYSDFGKLYTGIGTVKLDRDVYVMMDESTVMVTE